VDLDLRVQCFSEGFVRWRRFPDLVPQEWLGNYSLGVVLLRFSPCACDSCGSKLELWGFRAYNCGNVEYVVATVVVVVI